MNQLLKIFLGILGGVGVFKLIQNSNSKQLSQDGLAGIKQEGMNWSYLEKHYPDSNEGKLKSSISNKINAIITKSNKFKIGKSGVPNERRKGHSEYEVMHLLCESQDKDYINRLESYYNSKYYEHAKNQNKNRGSASTMESKNGYYYLYVVTD